MLSIIWETAKNLRRVLFCILHSYHDTLLSWQFTIFIHLSLLMMNSTVLILAVYKTPGLSHMNSVKSPLSLWVLVLHDYFLLGTLVFVCPKLISCWSIYLLHFITELKIHHLYSLIKCSVVLKNVSENEQVCKYSFSRSSEVH